MVNYQGQLIDEYGASEQSPDPSSQQCNTSAEIVTGRRFVIERNNNNNKTSVTTRQNTVNQNFLDRCGNKLEVHTHNHCPELSEEQHDIVTINVSGNRFQTHVSTLELYPNTLLGNRHKRQYYWNPKENEYFFDRHRACFESILYYYQSNGRLQRPDSVPLETFLEEISFFELGSQVYAEVRKNENITEVKHIELPKMVWRRYIWFFLEYPEHSIIARIFYIISMLFTILSCISSSIETLPYFTNKYHHICSKPNNTSLSLSVAVNCPVLFDSPFFIIQTVCVAYFTLEFVLRLLSTPSYPRFVLSLYNWIDLAAIIPYFILLGIQLSDKQLNINISAIVTNLRLARVLRLLRVLKLYFIFKEPKSMHAANSIMKESLIDLVMMFIILTLFAFLFGAATFFAESEANDMFDSIPVATYWGIMTITTVGYGDIYPITIGGRILACLCALCGIATTGLLISVLVDRYQRVFNRKMYVSNWELSSINLNATENDQDDQRHDILSNQVENSSIRSLPSAQKKHNEQEEHKRSSPNAQLLFSFYSDDTRTSSTDHATMELIERLMNAAKTSDSGVYLKLIDSSKDSTIT